MVTVLYLGRFHGRSQSRFWIAFASSVIPLAPLDLKVGLEEVDP